MKLEDQYKIVNFCIYEDIKKKNKKQDKTIHTMAIHYYHPFINKRYLNSKYRKSIM